MNISVSETMHAFITRRTREHFHSSVSEYIRSLVRQDQIKVWNEAPKEHFRLPRLANDCLPDATDQDDGWV
jgi:Arc/MetJ-type ribon-helix-helix transcriptional regulator